MSADRSSARSGLSAGDSGEPFDLRVGLTPARILPQERIVNFSMCTLMMGTFDPMLRTLSTLLDKGAAHVKGKGLDPDELVNARLAPDMFPLSRQVQIACDQAKSCAARLTGQEPPKFEDNEQTIAQLKARIERTLDYIESVPKSAYEGCEKRRVSFPLGQDMSLDMDGVEFLRDWTLPNFYFHVVTAYDILRNQGVPIGKQDFLAHAAYAIRRNGS